MDIWNLRGGRLRYLTNDQIEELHMATLHVLEGTGFAFKDERALKVFEEAGAKVDYSKQRVWIPPGLVNEAIKSSPEEITLAARNPKYDLKLEKDRVYFGTGTLAINVLDLETGELRRGNKQDTMDFPRFIDALPHIHFYKSMINPSDVPAKVADLYMIYGGFSNTEKQISSCVFSLEGAKSAVRMAEVVAGGSKELKKRPLLAINVLSTTPLQLDRTNTQILQELARRGVPLIIGSEPQAGSTAPVTLAGAVLLQNAEALAGITLAQLINPGTPVLMGAVGSIADMRSGAYCSGAVELGIMNVVAAQMSQHYKIPLYATGGMSDSKVSDAQAGYEKALQILMVALAGGNYIHDAAGLLEFCLTTSYEQYVIDDEICGMVARALEGISLDTETLALDLIDKVGPGGNFLSERHTVEFFRTEQFLPQISDRQTRQAWEKKGSKTAAERAKEKAKEILQTHHPVPLPADIDRELQDIIKTAESKLT
ncbi:trimethylamine methyltransferase family protein [Candidatus Bipolaricaulota bacterium]|nr:trimethylamine methyltransferase family protein [Candidatus Bipolaricaulota bacterium]